MGASASIALTSEQKAQLVSEARSAYEKGSSETGTDLELYQQVANAYESKYNEIKKESTETSNFSDLGKVNNENAVENKGPVSVSRILSTAEEVQDDLGTDSDEEGDDLEHNITKPRKGSDALLTAKTSQAMLADMIDEEEKRQNKVADFFGCC